MVSATDARRGALKCGTLIEIRHRDLLLLLYRGERCSLRLFLNCANRRHVHHDNVFDCPKNTFFAGFRLYSATFRSRQTDPRRQAPAYPKRYTLSEVLVVTVGKCGLWGDRGIENNALAPAMPCAYKWNSNCCEGEWVGVRAVVWETRGGFEVRDKVHRFSITLFATGVHHDVHTHTPKMLRTDALARENSQRFVP